MKQRSIVLVDFSECSASALKFAYQWSLNTGAELLVLHQLQIGSPGFTSIESEKAILESEKEAATSKMKAFLDINLNEKKKPQLLISSLSLPNQIDELSKDSNLKNIIFIGLKGTGVLKRIFIGSEAIRVIENTRNMVIAIPKDCKIQSIDKLNIAVSEDFNLNLLELNFFLKQFNKPLPELEFFNFSNSGTTTKKIEDLFASLKDIYEDDFRTSCTAYKFSGNKMTGIKELVEGQENQLILVQKGSRYFTDYIFRKFLINELVYDGKIPLVVLP